MLLAVVDELQGDRFRARIRAKSIDDLEVSVDDEDRGSHRAHQSRLALGDVAGRDYGA